MNIMSPLTMITNLVTSNPIGSTVLFALLIWITAVRIYNVRSLEYGDIRITGAVESLAKVSSSPMNTDLAKAYHYAVLSAEVYGLTDENGRPHRSWDTQKCAHDNVYQQWSTLSFPNNFPSRPVGETGNQAKLDSTLKYAVWYRETNQTDVEVVLAFAGTNGVGDIWSNLHWVSRFWPGGWNQYDLAATVGPALEKYVTTERFKDKANIKIITTGHSLGGGLAHIAAYASENIKRIYAFDSSSVTGFYDVDKPIRDASKTGMRIYRIHERGEVLGYLRAFMRVFYPTVEKNPAIIDATINFDGGLPIGQHSIENLACALVENSTDSN